MAEIKISQLDRQSESIGNPENYWFVILNATEMKTKRIRLEDLLRFFASYFANNSVQFTISCGGGITIDNTTNKTVYFGNTVTISDNTTVALANAAYTQANISFTQANNAFKRANTASTTANNAFDAANTAHDTAVSAYATANLASTNANSAHNKANTAFTKANSAHVTANNAYTQANVATTNAGNAFDRANNTYTTTASDARYLKLTGGTLTGDLTVGTLAGTGTRRALVSSTGKLQASTDTISGDVIQIKTYTNAGANVNITGETTSTLVNIDGYDSIFNFNFTPKSDNSKIVLNYSFIHTLSLNSLKYQVYNFDYKINSYLVINGLEASKELLTSWKLAKRTGWLDFAWGEPDFLFGVSITQSKSYLYDNSTLTAKNFGLSHEFVGFVDYHFASWLKCYLRTYNIVATVTEIQN